MFQRVVRRLRAIQSARELYLLLGALLRLIGRRLAQTPGYGAARAALVARYVALNIRHRHGQRRLRLAEDELVVLCLVRDGERYVRAFIEHYLALGAAHIVLLDNGSQDGTVAVAQCYPRVTILSTGLSYRRFQVELKRYLIQRFGRRRWSLLVDIDELFDYPGSARVDIACFLRYLRSHGYNGVVAHMLDMFAAGSLAEQAGEPAGEELRDAYPLADLSGIAWEDYAAFFGQSSEIANPAIRLSRGGVRRQLFGVNVLLTKHPLLFLEGAVRPVTPSAHRVSGARLADLSCVLFHYQLTGGFAAKVRRAVAEENYYQRSAEYKGYQKALAGGPELRIDLPASRPVRSADELAELGFLVVSPAYRSWVEQAERAAREVADTTPALLEGGAH